MPLYQYLAKKNPRETVEDTIEAASRDEALKQIAELGYAPIKVVAMAKEETSQDKMNADRPIPPQVMEDFMRQFASLTRSQIPVLSALRILEEQAVYPRLKIILGGIQKSVQVDGKSLSEAMKGYPRAFQPDVVNLIFAGETGGALQEVLDELAQKLEREQVLRSKLQSAVTYPLFVGGFGILTVIFLILFVLPKILKTLKGFGADLPLPTQILVAITQATGSVWFWIIAGLVVTTAAFMVINFIQTKRESFDRMILKLPVAGSMLSTLGLSRFCRSLGLLLNHGVLILPALDAAVPVVGNRHMEAQLSQLSVAVRDGRALTDGLRQLSISTPFLLQSLAIGESGGRMSEVLKEVADYYEKEAEKKMQAFAGLLEPAMILSVGLIVGFIVMAVLLPIFEVGASVK